MSKKINPVNAETARLSCQTYYNITHEQYMAEYYDELNNKPYDIDFLTSFIREIPSDGKILDIGCCSAAQQARFFADKGFNVTSIDLSEECIKTARCNFPDIRFRQMDMTEMSFRNDTFQAINASYSLIHIPNGKLPKLFSDFNRILKPHGKIAISVHAGDFYGYYDDNKIPVFYRTFTGKQLDELMEKYGFTLLQIDQRKPIYEFELQTERIYLIGEKNG